MNNNNKRNKPDHDSSPETEQKLFRGGTQVDKIQLKQEKTEDQKMKEIKQILLELSREVKEMSNDINQNNEEMRSLREENHAGELGEGKAGPGRKDHENRRKDRKTRKGQDTQQLNNDRNADGDKKRRATEKHNGKNDKQRVEPKRESKEVVQDRAR
jgi:hypothetical protein